MNRVFHVVAALAMLPIALAAIPSCSLLYDSRPTCADADADAPDDRVEQADAEADVPVERRDPDADPEPDPEADPDVPEDETVDLDAAEEPSGACDYSLILDRPGDFHYVDWADPLYTADPPEIDGGFHCLKWEFVMQTADTIDDMIEALGGCPIRIIISELFGGTTRLLAGSHFHFRGTGESCPSVSPRVHMYARNFTDGTCCEDYYEIAGWSLGMVYRVVMEIKPAVGSVTLYDQEGAQVGPAIELALTGLTVEDTLDARLRFGAAGVADGSVFPDYEATYRDLKVWADAP